MYSVDEQLTVALKKRNYDEAERLLNEEGANINWRNVRDETPVFFFADTQSLKTLQWLIDKGADVNIPNHSGETPLFSAVMKNDLKAVDLLLASGADVNIKNDRHIAPLMQAVLNEKDHGVVDRLLEANPEIDPIADTQTTPLLAAAARAKSSYVEKLIDAGADVEAVDYLGQGLLHAALLSFDLQVLQTVAQKAPLLDPNYAARSGTTAMSLSLYNPQATKILMDMGGDPSAMSANRMNEGVTLLMGVVQSCPLALPQIQEKNKDPQAVIQIVMGGGGGHDQSNAELVKEMIAKGADATVRSAHGMNALGAAIQVGAVDLLPDIVSGGADPSRPATVSSLLPYDLLTIKTLDREDPDLLDYIDTWSGLGFPFARPQWDETIDGSWTQTYQDGFAPMPTVLQNLLSAQFIEAIERCLSLGAPVNEADGSGYTLAHHALAFDGLTPEAKKALAIVKKAKNIDKSTLEEQKKELFDAAEERVNNFRDLLNQNNINWNAQNNDGNTPLHIAAQKGVTNWAKWLVVDQKVNLNVRNNEGLTAAGIALKEGQIGMFYALCEVAQQQGVDLKKGVLLDTTQASSDDFRERSVWLRAVASLDWNDDQRDAKNEDGQNALYIASATDQSDVVRSLLKLGFSPNAQDNDGNTALMQSVFNESGEVIRLLRAAGVKVNEKNNQGQTASDVADYVKSQYVHRALEASDLSELIQDLENPAPTDDEKKIKERFQFDLDNVVRKWNSQEPLELPEHLKEVEKKEDVASPAPAAPPTPAAPAPAASAPKSKAKGP